MTFLHHTPQFTRQNAEKNIDAFLKTYYRFELGVMTGLGK